MPSGFKIGADKRAKAVVRAATSAANRRVAGAKIMSRTVQPAGNGRLQSYALALSKPFDENAVGAQVPDMYSGPTVTYHAEGTVTIRSNSGGVASFCLSSVAYASLIDVTGASVGASSGMAQITTSPSVYSATTGTNLAAVFSSYRVVGVGFRFRNLLPPTTATGRITVAPVAAVGAFPSYAFLSATPAVANNLTRMLVGIDTGGGGVGFAADILEFPGAEEYTIQDLITNTVECVCKPLTPQAFAFTNTSTSGIYNTSTTYGEEVIINSVTGNVNLADNSGQQGLGWEALLINANGLPPSSDCVELEYIFHYEGVPAMPTGAGALLPGSPAVPHINITGHQNVLSTVLSKPAVKLVTQVGKSAFNGFAAGGVAGAGANVLSLMMAKMGLQL